jgi:phosphate transport system permease protein
MKLATKDWIQQGHPWVWLNAGAVAICMVMVFGLLIFIAVKGAVHFWPNAIYSGLYAPPNQPAEYILGEIREREIVTAKRMREANVDIPADVEFVPRALMKVGNRDMTGKDFRWILTDYLTEVSEPIDAVVFERREWGNFYGFPVDIIEAGEALNLQPDVVWPELETRLARVLDIFSEIRDIEVGAIGRINYQIEQLRLERRAQELAGTLDSQAVAQIEAERADLDARYAVLENQLIDLYAQINRDKVRVKAISGATQEIALSRVVRAVRPNDLSLIDKLVYYISHFVEFVIDEPREANTEGGIFPAIFGTVVMVIVMSIIVTPFGVIAAVYLREYAKQGPLTRTIRIAVNNLAGVPSIVYGVFGLGFFVYAIGGGIDQAFYPESLPAPMFGTPGLLWASLTLALLTVPVVIVATEEGLTRIPRAVREGSLALGATKFETLWRVVLPMSSPAMMTGLILAIARAAGEVAPLMLVGVVKMAPSLPVDLNAPFIHFERKFMHLGFHIYDVGFQSPNVEAARPLVYATAFLLVAVIAILNLTAVMVRNRLRERYKSLEH